MQSHQTADRSRPTLSVVLILSMTRSGYLPAFTLYSVAATRAAESAIVGDLRFVKPVGTPEPMPCAAC